MKEKPVTWWQVNNIVPIIITLIGMTISFSALITRVAVLENKIDTLIAQNEQILIKYSGVETRYGELSLKVQALETKSEK